MTFAHYCDHPKRVRTLESVCGMTKPLKGVVSVTVFLKEPTPCPRCLEWVLEQGQLAAERLEITRSLTDEQQQQG